MEYILIVQAFVLLVVVYLFIQFVKDQRMTTDKAVEAERKAWADERRELLNRIQHPERMPTKTTGASAVRSNVSPETRRALAQVGTVAPQVNDGD